MTAAERVATRSRRPVRRFFSRLFFGLKLAAAIVAVAFISMALWDVGQKLGVAAIASPDRVQGTGVPHEKIGARGTPELREPDGETSPQPSSFPRVVKTIRITPAGN
jgi:hypothetical protein